MPKFKSRAEYEAWKSSQKRGKKESQESGATEKQDTLALHLREQKILKLIGELLRKGEDIDAVVLELNEQGYRTRTGDIWTFSQVKQFLAYYQKKKTK